MTFESFCEPDELFDKLMERYNAPPQIDVDVVKKIHLRVCVSIRDLIQVCHIQIFKLSFAELPFFFATGALHFARLPELSSSCQDKQVHR